MRGILILATAACLAPARAETIVAASPCLPATVPSSVDLDTTASLNKPTLPPVTFDFYEDVKLRGAIYGEAVVASVTVDPQNGTVQGMPRVPGASETSPGCH